jgi:hypothetical protein
MTTLSLVWGVLALVGMMVAFMPCFGSLNWLNIPFSAVGLIISVIALATDKTGRKGGAIGGLVLCAVAVIFGLIRLTAGLGVF